MDTVKFPFAPFDAGAFGAYKGVRVKMGRGLR